MPPIHSVPFQGDIAPIALQLGPHALHGGIPEDVVFRALRANGHRHQAERRQFVVHPHPTDRLPDPARHQTRSPIPAEVVLGLSREDAVLLAHRSRLIADRNRERGLFQQCLSLLDRTVENHLEGIISRQGQFRPGNPPASVHVIRPKHTCSIDQDVRMGIQPFEFQCPLPFFRWQGQGPAVNPILSFDPLHGILIPLQKWIFQQTMDHEVGMDGPGNLRRPPDPRRILKNPVTVQPHE